MYYSLSRHHVSAFYCVCQEGSWEGGWEGGWECGWEGGLVRCQEGGQEGCLEVVWKGGQGGGWERGWESGRCRGGSRAVSAAARGSVRSRSAKPGGSRV